MFRAAALRAPFPLALLTLTALAGCQSDEAGLSGQEARSLCEEHVPAPYVVEEAKAQVLADVLAVSEVAEGSTLPGLESDLWVAACSIGLAKNALVGTPPIPADSQIVVTPSGGSEWIAVTASE